MAKHLFLYRHAEAVQAYSNDGDRDRELTSKGISQAHQMGAFLLTNHFNVKTIYSSTALRAHQTAAITAEALKMNSSEVAMAEELYNATTRAFFAFITSLDPVLTSVMCVGHNPTITYLAEYLTKESIGDMTPAGLAIIKFDIANWSEVTEGNGSLVKYMAPELI